MRPVNSTATLRSTTWVDGTLTRACGSAVTIIAKPFSGVPASISALPDFDSSSTPSALARPSGVIAQST